MEIGRLDYIIRDGLGKRVAKLQAQSEAQWRLGHNYMRVDTKNPEGSHAENVDIHAILALDPNNMELGMAYPSVTAMKVIMSLLVVVFYRIFPAWVQDS
jgi:hypothetical protein